MMLRTLFFISACLIAYIPHTSIQDVSVSTRNYQNPVRRGITNNNTVAIEDLIRGLTEQQYQYEIAYYALTLTNVFPNFSKFFHEQSEQKYSDIKGLIHLCQVINLDINFKSISSNLVNRPLRLLSPDRINKTNFVEFFSHLKTSECDTTFTLLTTVYYQAMNMTVPLKIYLKEKLFTKQILTCKLTSDLYIQLARFIESNSNDRAIPFSFIFVDSQTKHMLS
ncbi:unnamed protein product [Rotaria socialis]|uniref:Uncharacterized protein n=2 Tax=Rotaria socialis TaxID=392032 RepID=A0A818ABR5_9BILA|nr:unnamed protein product [Rotaria socialis]CAF4427157.1 unnamed protein product [Rotaria socialis]